MIISFEIDHPDTDAPMSVEVKVEGDYKEWSILDTYYLNKKGNYIEGKKRERLDRHFLGNEWFNLQIQTKLENLAGE